MSDQAVHRASDLAGAGRAVVERWLGRALASDETISVNAYWPHPAPVGDARDALRRDIISQAQEIGARAPGVTEQEVDALLDEAFAAALSDRAPDPERKAIEEQHIDVAMK